MENLNGKIAFECEYMRSGTIWRKFTAQAVKRPIGGVYVGGLCFEPSGADILAGMSKRHWAAIERAGAAWWSTSGLIDQLRLDLYDTKNKPLGSIIARAIPIAFDCTMLGFIGPKSARAIRKDNRAFHVEAIDKSISMTVNAKQAENRFWMHPAYGAPEFYYS